MLRNLLLKIVAPAALAIGGVPAIASAHSHVSFRFGVGYAPGYYAPAYYGPTYCAPTYVAPAYVAPAPVVVTPTPCVQPAPVVVTPAPVYTAPAVVVTPAPTFVYSTGWHYPHRVFWSHGRWCR